MNNHSFFLSWARIALLLNLLLCVAEPASSSSITNGHSQATARPTSVLVLHSYHPGLSWTDGLNQALSTELAKLPEVTLFHEYLDSKRLPLAQIKKSFALYLQSKYAAKPPDLIIACDNNALSFLRTGLVPCLQQRPLIFCGINNFQPALLDGLGDQVTGVVEKVDPVGTMELIKQLQPASRRLVIIAGSSATATAVLGETHQALDDHSHDLQLLWWHNLESQDLFTRLASLDKNDAVLLLLFNKDKSGHYYSYEESAHLIARHSPAPVYGLWDFYLGTGVVGGRLASSRDQGISAGTMARQFLSTGQMPALVKVSPNRSLFHAPTLEHHGLDASHLPREVEFVGQRQQNGQPLTLGIALLCLGLVTIFFFAIFLLISSRGSLPALLHRATLALSTLFLAAMLLVSSYNEIRDYNLQVERHYQQLLEEKKTSLKLMVEQAMSQIHYARQHRQINDEQLKKTLLDRLAAYSFHHGAGYIYVTAYDGTVLVNNARPELIGQNILEMRDSHGRQFVKEIVTKAQLPQGGFSSYLWPKPGTFKPVSKLSYTQGVQDWQWAVGTGMYLENIESVNEQERKRHRRHLLAELTKLLLVAAVSLALIWLLTGRLIRKVTQEVENLEQGLASKQAQAASLEDDNYVVDELRTIAQGIRQAFTSLATASSRLQESQDLYLATMHRSPDPMLLLEGEAITECNRAAASLLAYDDPQQLRRSYLADLSPPQQPQGEDSQKLGREMIDAAISKGSHRFEWLLRRANGSAITVEMNLSITPVAFYPDKPVLQCHWRDLSQEKEVAEQVRRAQAVQQESLAKSHQLLQVMRGREERIIEVKEEVNELLAQLGREAKYGRETGEE